MTTKTRDSFTRRQAIVLSGALAAPMVARADTPAVKFGILQPLTGALAYNGNQARAGALMAVEDINAGGGIRSLGGAKLDPVISDAQSRPDVAAAEVDKLAEQGVVAIIGASASAIGLASTQAAARYGLAQILDVGTNEQLVRRGLTNVFRLTPGSDKCSTVALENLVKINQAAGNPAKTVAIVYEDSSFGSGINQLLQQRLPPLGLEVVESIGHPTPQRDFTNIALRLKAARPDILIPSNYVNEYTLLATTLLQQRVPVKGIYSILGGAASNIRFVREHNEAAQYVMDCNHWYDPRKPLSQALAAKVAAAKLDLTYDIMTNYSCVLLLADALERAGSVDRAKVLEALASSSFSGHVMPYGPTKFENGNNLAAQPVNTQVRGESIEVIFPEEFASAKAVFPVPVRG